MFLTDSLDYFFVLRVLSQSGVAFGGELPALTAHLRVLLSVRLRNR